MPVLRPADSDNAVCRLVTHESRSAIRRLVNGLIDAWDSRDVARCSKYFVTSKPEWVADEAKAAIGHPAILAAFERNASSEPWQLHFLTNESITVDSNDAHGTWLAFTVSTIRGDLRAAYGGFDLAIDAKLTPEGWRVSTLRTSRRFLSPYQAGWLTERDLDLDVIDGGGCQNAVFPSRPRLTPTFPLPAGRDDLAALAVSLRSETAVRRHVAEFFLGLDRGDDVDVLTRAWTPDGRYEVVTTRDSDAALIATGQGAVARALEADRAQTSAWIRCLTNECAYVDGDRAWCRWRDLWTAVRPVNEAWWIAHVYQAELCRVDGQWLFAVVRREPLLSCSYHDGWSKEGGQ